MTYEERIEVLKETAMRKDILMIVKGVDRRKANAADSDKELAELLGL